MTVLNNFASFRFADSDLMEDTSTFIKSNPIINSLFSFPLTKSRKVNTSLSVVSINSISKNNEEIINNIKSLSFLKDNWDEENAKRIGQISISTAIKIVKRFDLLNKDIYLSSPGPNEEILLIVKECSREIELIIYPNKLKFVKFDNNVFQSQGDFILEDIPNLLYWTKNIE